MKTALSYLGWFIAIGAVLFWFTAPADDQVCRMAESTVSDFVHGIGWQPTCQALIDATDARARSAEDLVTELEERVEALEEELR